MTYWTAPGIGTSGNTLGRPTRDWFVARITRGFFLVLAALLAGRLLAARISFFDSLPGAHDLLPSMTDGTALLRWWDMYQAALLRGGLADVLLAGILASALTCLRRWPRRIALVFLVMICAANVEHIKYNFAHIDLAALGDGFDPDFLRGSLTWDAVKYTLAIGIVLAVVAIGFRSWIVRRVAPFVMAVLLAAATFAMPEQRFAAPGWMQDTPLVSLAPSRPLPADRASPPPESIAGPAPPATTPGGYNLLVVYLEGLSVRSLARGEMQNLQSLQESAISLDGYIGRQIITANGLYATLIGDTPSFLERMPKWNALTPDTPVARTALPRLLRRHGYATSYLQAAPLDFMDKRTHMAVLGFDTILGDADWTEARGRNGWGIDDVSLMEYTLAHLDTLPADQPWFASVLTSGTHSPYNVPGIARPDRGQALRQADAAIAVLIEGLEARGLLQTTTVIITSDEGREVDARAGFLSDLELNRLPLIVLHPDVADLQIDTPVLNTDLRDLALTLTGPLTPATLRDVLPTHDDLVFGNIITGKVFWYDTAGQRLHACLTEDFTCLRWDRSAALFDPDRPTGDPVHMPEFAELMAAHDAAEPQDRIRDDKDR